LISRFDAIAVILQRLQEQDAVVSTTGMISREVFTARDRPGNFYMIGSMGLASSLGLGLALMNPRMRVFVLEGDGSALMNLGTFALIAAESPPNLVHVVLDNETYESTGAQPSISGTISLSRIAAAAGYSHVVEIKDKPTLEASLDSCATEPGPHLLLIKTGIVPVPGIPRVSHAPTEIRTRFKKYVAQRHDALSETPGSRQPD
jgi:thiamine pyrophosphate-dependent acetolactate synthase large subunit-like protein